jgi:hypothetical protein
MHVAIDDWNIACHGELVWTEADHLSTFMTTLQLARHGSISLQTVVCNLRPGPGKPGMKTIAMLDSGSNVTLIDELTAYKLGLKRISETETKSVNIVQGHANFETHKVEVPLTSSDGLTSVLLIAMTFKDLTKNTGIVDWSSSKQNFEHLKTVPFEPLPNDPRITLLIGTDNVSMFLATPNTYRFGEKG